MATSCSSTEGDTAPDAFSTSTVRPASGADGPLTTRWSRYPDPVSDAFIAAGLAAGYPVTEDYNGAQQEGFGRWQATIRNGRRCSAAVAYLRPALARAALTVETDTLATRVVLDGRRAIGVEYLKRGALVPLLEHALVNFENDNRGHEQITSPFDGGREKTGIWPISKIF